MNYFGLCETDFKLQYYNQAHSFRNRLKCNAIELSEFVWECKDAGSVSRFVAHHRANKEISNATSVWRKNLKFSQQTLKQHSTKEPN